MIEQEAWIGEVNAQEYRGPCGSEFARDSGLTFNGYVD
ncbi:hypothetical protein FBY12_1752 [Pseudomonas sp. SJZ131]|nr:hypothetical protein FBY12_1752 [Pseudomonas sp. SJZ131]